MGWEALSLLRRVCNSAHEGRRLKAADTAEAGARLLCSPTLPLKHETLHDAVVLH